MIDKVKSNVVEFSSNPCFHQNKTAIANKRAILLKQNQDHTVRTRKGLFSRKFMNHKPQNLKYCAWLAQNAHTAAAPRT
jgi:hypothetical protein